MNNKFFVYGTLKIGGYFAESFNKVRKNSTEAKLKGFDLFKIGSGNNSWFPGIIPGEGEVIGEVHEYAEEHIKDVYSHMDAIEGYSETNPEASLYRRELMTVELEDGSTETVNVYVFNREIEKDYPKVKSGVWPV